MSSDAGARRSADQVVVGVAIVRAGRVLAARRSAPAELAGRWEFPGGKVEAGESEPAAARRECREELGVQIAVGDLLARTPIRAGLVLHLYAGVLLGGEPAALQDHDALRWLGCSDLTSIDWLPADRPLLPAVATRLG